MSHFLEVINEDPDYLTRLQRHYVMMKEKVEGKKYRGRPFETPGEIKRVAHLSDMSLPPVARGSLAPARPGSEDRSRPRIGRNEPCPCGSGKKYKQCCLKGARGEAEERAKPETTGSSRDPAAKGEERVDEGPLTDKERTLEARAMVRAMARVRRERPGRQYPDVRTFEPIKRNSLIAFDLLDLLLREYALEATSREMSDNYKACLILLEDALTEIRYAVERERGWAIDAAERIQREMLERVFKVEVDKRVQDDLIQVLHEAKLELHPDIRSKSEELARYYGRFTSHKAPPNLEKTFDEIAARSPDGPFQAMEALMADLDLFPPEGQVLAIAEMAKARNPLIRELAALLLLHPNREVRRHVPGVFSELISPKSVSPVSLRRMIGLRGWLPEAERPALDHLIAGLRAARVECAPMPPLRRAKVYASPMDGSGAQGFLIVVGQKRVFQLMTVLVKQGWGIRETFTHYRLSREEVESIVGDMTRETKSQLIEPRYMSRVISHFIRVGRQKGSPPPAGLLQVAEAMGVEYWAPRRLVLDEEISVLEELIDPRYLASEYVKEVLDGSRRWQADKDFAISWFEDDNRVDEVLKSIFGGDSLPSFEHIEKARKRIMKEVIETKYDVWAERLLSMTLWAKACKGDGPVAWEDLFIIARQFRLGIPAKKIPLLVGAAERSVYSGLLRRKAGPK